MKILIVDDEKSVQRLFSQRFRKEVKSKKLALYFAGSGQEALNILAQLGPSDIMILSDINMPTMSGLELLTIIKRQYPNIAVFMLTAYSDEKNRHQAELLGADGYLTKPLDFKLLKQLLNIAI